ncbi:hypothetical protein FA13DRAFT_1623791 [Coprinellus micaceus]|uniref:Exonuclease domain-containing protein n=1 Tax=Coprinellus micaceus TaxID=71717 RepID=A0A4Y7TPL5_COPMI|nr:hypothetical protein FA13DRAFT_1623791 [Coprinellus micaceus]
MPHFNRRPPFPKTSVQTVDGAGEPPKRVKQTVEAFLVLDVEATCKQGTDFDYPNEIIEFPVCLMRWKDKGDGALASRLEVVDEFRTFVRPTWRPTLTEFCIELTGISQAQVDSAPLFPEVLTRLEKFLMNHGLINEDGERLERFCWCSDGPYDVRDFIVKQCFISKSTVPSWMQGDVLDVRSLVLRWTRLQSPYDRTRSKKQNAKRPFANLTSRQLNIAGQLKTLGLSHFEGRQHSGIDDTRNITRILAELARKGIHLQPNAPVKVNKRWHWMGPRRGQILEESLP